MKKLFFILLCFFASIKIVSASSIDTVDMDITLDVEGTATITETWEAYVDQGTEGWHPYYNLGKSEITVVGASIDGENYTIDNYWKENANFSEKAYRAGTYQASNDEIDVVFGISNYGQHTYKITYKISNFASNLTDADMVYWQLFPNNFSSSPNNVTIKISGPYEYPDTLEVWGYGKYGAPCYVENGSIYMTSNGIISSNEYLTILVKFPQNTFETTSRLDNDFNYYLDISKEGSTEYYQTNNYNEKETFFTKIVDKYGYDSPYSWLFWLIIFSPAIIGILLGITSEIKKNLEEKEIKKRRNIKLPKEIENFREIPCNKDIFKAFWIANEYKLNRSLDDFIGAIILKWLHDGNIKVDVINKNNMIEKEVITFNAKPTDANKQEKKLYDYMKEASKDGILEKGEFIKWCRKNYYSINSWENKTIEYEKNELIKDKSLKKEMIKRGLIFKYDDYYYKAESNIYNDALQLKGLKQYLTEFSKIDTRMPIEVKLWNEYLIFAQILGISKQVMKKFKDLYPEINKEMNKYNFDYDSYTFVNTVLSSGIVTANISSRTSDFASGDGGGGSFGGDSSSGGGGGFR